MQNIVFISYYFPPNSEIASERSLKFVRSLCKAGNNVTLITIDNTILSQPYIMQNNRANDLYSMSFEVKHVMPRLSFLLWFSKKRPVNKILNLMTKITSRVLNKFIHGDVLGLTWNVQLSKTLEDHLKNNETDMVICTLSPFSSMYVAARICNKYGIKYILDFRDLWLNNPDHKLVFIAKKYALYREKYAVTHAHKILTVSNGLACYFKEQYHIEDVIVLYNLVDENFINYYKEVIQKISQEWENERYLNIFFAGTIYKHLCTYFNGMGGLDVFIKALLNISKEEKKLIKIHIYGNSKIDYEKLIKYDVLDNFIFYGRCDKELVLQGMSRADALISLIHNVKIANNPYKKGLLSAKIFEYLISGKPVLNISSIDAEINQFVKQENIDNFYSLTSCDIDSLVKYLRVLFKNRVYQRANTRINDKYTWEEQFYKIELN